MKKYDKIQFNNCQFNLKFLYIFLSLIYLITALSLIPHQKKFFIFACLAKQDFSVYAPFNSFSEGGEAKITLVKICLNQTYQYADDLKNDLDDD